MDKSLKTVNIFKIVNKKQSNQQDLVVTETPLTIFVNNQELVTLLCSPIHQKNLAVGFLFSEGFLKKKADIKSIILSENRGIVWISINEHFEMDEYYRKGRTITSGCARGLTFHKVFENWDAEYITSKHTIKPHIVSDISNELKQNSILYQQSGGAHSAALYQKNKFLFSRQDIGRHNAVDKIIGECIVKKIVSDDKILMTSGRLSSEIVLKAARWKFPILISRTAATSTAIKIAEELGVTLIGFARCKRMNIYTNSWRVK